MAFRTSNQRRPFRFMLEHFFGIDIRSLALFRIGLASLLLADLAWRLPDLTAHYTDQGVLPRTALLTMQGGSQAFPSLHLVTGSAAGQSTLFGIAALFALALLFGYRTRLATFASWVLLVSLHHRNPIILQGGDLVLRLLLFWSLFLPLGACFSVDRALNSSHQRPPLRILSFGTLGLLLQICSVYWFSALLKTDPSWRSEGTAVYLALSIDQMVTPFGKFLLGYPELLKVLTFATMGVELLGPFFAFLPSGSGRLRLLTVLMFLGFHAGLAACLALGLFPYICGVAWLAFIPSWFWQRLARRVARGRRHLKIIYAAEDAGALKTASLAKTFFGLPDEAVSAAPADDPVWHATVKDQPWQRVVVANEGRYWSGVRALGALCRATPPLWFFGVLLGRPIIAGLGDALWGRLFRCCPVVTELRLLTHAPVHVHLSRGMNLLAAFFIVYVLSWNVKGLNPTRFAWLFPPSTDWIDSISRVSQRWAMFAPSPRTADGWYVVPGRLRDGTTVDLFKDGGPVTWEKPPLVSVTYKRDRWRKYMMNLCFSGFRDHRFYYARYLYDQWNRSHPTPKQVESLDLCFMEEVTLPNNGGVSARKWVFWHYSDPPSGSQVVNQK